MGNIHFHVGIATSTDWVRCTLASTPLLNFFFFSSRRRHTRWPRDWSSDVCSSDLLADAAVRTASLVSMGYVEAIYCPKREFERLRSVRTGFFDQFQKAELARPAQGKNGGTPTEDRKSVV